MKLSLNKVIVVKQIFISYKQTKALVPVYGCIKDAPNDNMKLMSHVALVLLLFLLVDISEEWWSRRRRRRRINRVSWFN